MNKAILNNDIQEYINSNLNTDVADLVLRGMTFEAVEAKEVIVQIEAKKKAEKKLPTWYTTSNIIYPNKLNIEQTSSEVTALYKSHLVSGKCLIDLTGGFGVDCYYFSKHIDEIIHCELNDELSQITNHNFQILGKSNITCLNENGIDALKRMDQQFDYIYIDPSRRDSNRKKVFLLSDCTPNVKTFQGLFLKYAKYVLIKTSPLLDIKATKNDLNHVKELHIVAVNNEVKELLWILEREYNSEFNIKTVNITQKENQTFEFKLEEEPKAQVDFSLPLNYLYEPNASILKAGAFNTTSSKLGVQKLHKHSHLYTSEELTEFPGRRFKIEKTIPYNKKALAKERIHKANVTTRNFPLNVGDLRKKLKIKDGGHLYLFFTTNLENEKIIIICSKM